MLGVDTIYIYMYVCIYRASAHNSKTAILLTPKVCVRSKCEGEVCVRSKCEWEVCVRSKCEGAPCRWSKKEVQIREEVQGTLHPRTQQAKRNHANLLEVRP